MKMLVAALAFIISSQAMAQGQNIQMQEEVYTKKQVDYSSKGFRMALLKPFLSAKLVSYDYRVKSNDVEMNDLLGLSLGYARLPIGHLGWSSNLTYITLQDVKQSAGGLVRLDGNLGYTVNSLFSFKGGLNLSTFTRGGDSVEASVGGQTSIGLQFSKTVGLDLSAVLMQQRIRADFTDVYFVEQGAELTLTVTL